MSNTDEIFRTIVRQGMSYGLSEVQAIERARAAIAADIARHADTLAVSMPYWA